MRGGARVIEEEKEKARDVSELSAPGKTNSSRKGTLGAGSFATGGAATISFCFKGDAGSSGREAGACHDSDDVPAATVSRSGAPTAGGVKTEKIDHAIKAKCLGIQRNINPSAGTKQTTPVPARALN